ncbi:hypothetical protein SEUCBS139899_009574 [Sporothrix eucalyptigena]|uniref:Diphthine--ammonia ligase n=1 Tax=Sporothrix eucalyptigena TaxID=1812306 RepID=A0ABP0C7W3_9PEZI
MSLNVIALVSGGKDSFFSLLHCLAHGHRVVALANLYPEELDSNDDNDEEDLNSFMYQTVGHQVLPLYAEATGLPLYREPIRGQAVHSGREYHPGGEGDETESMTRLLRTVMEAHPEANAVCAGALLSTYQRTRVESVAVRLGLVSLAYLWKYTTLPVDGDYLSDLSASGFDARIIKVASGGLDETLLWTNVAVPAGRARIQRALQRLGLADAAGRRSGSLLGEGGEYETLVVDGPLSLFRGGSIAVADADRRVVHESGGTAWLQIKKATVVPRQPQEGVDDIHVNQPRLFDARFAGVLAALREGTETPSLDTLFLDDTTSFSLSSQPPLVTTWRVVPDTTLSPSISDATQSIVDQVRQRLADTSSTTSPTHSVVRTLVVLRRMADFPAFNAVYGTLFTGAPNPPSRVTIACGEGLPASFDVAVFLSVLEPTTAAGAARQGLHVQSRSYWAPANIGPYSQAVSLLAHAASGVGGPRVVSIAGQIPLVPASMDLPTEAVEAKEGGRESSTSTAPASFAFQTTLALQHLWRIGIDLDVQWWGSAVAYVPREPLSSLLPQKALAVSRAWRTAHEWKPKEVDEDGDDGDNDDEGPDLWDRKFDSRYALYGSGDGEDETPQLPDWDVLQSTSASCHTSSIPPVFLVEVQELPRSAPVEWHAQTGFSQVQASRGSRVQCRSWSNEASKTWSYQTVLTTTPKNDGDYDSEDDPQESRPAGQSQVVVQTTTAWAYQEGTKITLSEDDLTNVDMVYAEMHACEIPDSLVASTPVVPCFSLWNGRGEPLAAVVVRTQHGTGDVK